MKSPVKDHIEATPGVCGGKPRVANTRIRVQDIVVWTEEGLSPDEIVVGYPHLSLADVRAALAYHHDHREEIDRQIRESDEFVASMKAKHAQQPNPGANGTTVSP
jgi:uncharacterized protein (DUF433 family)